MRPTKLLVHSLVCGGSCFRRYEHGPYRPRYKARAPRPKIIKLSDGGGLQLWITPDGAKRWRLAYRFGGAQKTFAIGVYPEVGFETLDAREGARQALARGKDPSQIRKAARQRKPKRALTRLRPSRAQLADKEASRSEGGGNAAKVRMVHEFRASDPRIEANRRHYGS